MAYPSSEHPTGVLLSVIVLSFIIASSLSVYPLSPHIALLRPLILIMVLIFWLLFQPRYVGVFSALAVGLLADLLLDTMLGQQAFAAVLVAFFIKVMSVYIKQLDTAMAWVIAGLGLLVFQLSMWVIQALTQQVFVWQSILSVFMSVLMWPLLLLVLRPFTR